MRRKVHKTRLLADQRRPKYFKVARNYAGIVHKIMKEPSLRGVSDARFYSNFIRLFGDCLAEENCKLGGRFENGFYNKLWFTRRVKGVIESSSRHLVTVRKLYKERGRRGIRKLITSFEAVSLVKCPCL